MPPLSHFPLLIGRRGFCCRRRRTRGRGTSLPPPTFFWGCSPSRPRKNRCGRRPTVHLGKAEVCRKAGCRKSARPVWAKRSLLWAAVRPSSQAISSFSRARLAAHQLVATIATPSLTPLPVAAGVGLARVDDEGVADAGQRLDGVDIRARHRPAEDGALLEDGVEHAGRDDIDAEKRLTGHDPDVVDAGHRLADDPEALRVLERHAGEIRRPNGYDAAIWTALASRLHEPGKRGEPFTVNAAIRYLAKIWKSGTPQHLV